MAESGLWRAIPAYAADANPATCTKRWPPAAKTAYFTYRSRNPASSAASKRNRRRVIDMPHLAEPVVIKRYANRRLYLAAAGRYVTLGDLAGMVQDEEDFVVCDAHTGEDITHSILKQIIVERSHHG